MKKHHANKARNKARNYELVSKRSRKGGKKTMALDDAKSQLAAVGSVIEVIAADQATFIAAMADLTKQVADGTPATQAELQELVVSATAIKDRLEAVDTSVPPKP
jgi:hypothetical protein